MRTIVRVSGTLCKTNYLGNLYFSFTLTYCFFFFGEVEVISEKLHLKIISYNKTNVNYSLKTCTS